jgi:ABC-type transport system involved in multi-copper enzyme maturation permease subunit
VHWVRAGYSLALLVALAVTYLSSFPRSTTWELLTGNSGDLAINDQAAFAERFVSAIFLVQFLAIVLLTPIYAASAIPEERERGTLDVLLTLPLRDSEILSYKVLSRMVHLVAVLFATVPFVTLLFALGGVDWPTIMLRLAANAVALGCLAVVGVVASARARRTLTSVCLTHAYLLPLTMHLYLLTTYIAAASWTSLIVVGGLAAACVAWFARRRLTDDRRCFDVPPAKTPAWARNDEREVAPVGQSPLWWKEMHWIRRPQDHPQFWGLAALFYVIPLGLSLPLFGPMWGRRFAVVGGLLFCGYVAARASYSIAGERERRTLDSLLATPLNRFSVLRVKWLAALAHAWIIAAFAIVPMALDLLVAAFAIAAISPDRFALSLHPLGAVSFAAALAVHAVFWSALGLFLSVRCQTPLAAAVRLGYVALVLIGGTLCYHGFRGGEAHSTFDRFLTLGLNPMLAWPRCAFTWQDWHLNHHLPRDLAAVVGGVCVYLAAALVLLAAAFWSFHRQQTRP